MNRTHGMWGTPIYQVWHHMKQRCRGTSDRRSTKNYHDRGILYDPAWETFEGFIADMGDSYAAGLHLDRIDNDKGYSKNNCRWVSARENQRNRRDTIRITINGETRSLIEWCEIHRVSYSRVIKRYSHYKITDPEKLFSKGKLHVETLVNKPVLPCTMCGTESGSIRSGGRPIRKRGMCNTCYARLITRGVGT